MGPGGRNVAQAQAVKKQPHVFQDHKKFEDVEALDLRMGHGREHLETWGYDQNASTSCHAM